VESAEEHLLRVAFTTFVGQQDPGGELEEVGGVGARDLGELLRLDLVVRGSAARDAPPAEYGHLDHVLAAVRRACNRFRGGRRRRSWNRGHFRGRARVRGGRRWRR